MGVSNPPYEKLPEICAGQSAFWLRVAAMAPSVAVGDVRVTPLGDGVHRLEVSVINRGYLPTYILSSARCHDWNEPLHARFETSDCDLADPLDAHQRIGHLEGWGRGRHSGSGSLFHRYSRGSGHRARVTAVVQGTGTVKVSVGSCRVGWVETQIRIG